MSSNNAIRWGIVGTGGMAEAFTKALQAVEDATPFAVASRTVQGGRAFSEKYDIPQHYGSYRELLADPAVDVVYIATPHASHSEICIACLEMGKPVLCEKPFAIIKKGAEEEGEKQHIPQYKCPYALFPRQAPGTRPWCPYR